jgi:hypothetical protein
MRITRAAKVAAFPLTALILVALVACQGPIGPAGGKGDTGAPGADGDSSALALRNMPPALKAGMAIATQYLALVAREADGMAIDAAAAINAFNKYEILEVSKYFEDPEGVANLIYSLADLSDDDKKVVTVSLAAAAAMDAGDGESDDTTPDGDIDDTNNVDGTDVAEMPAHMKSVTGKAYLNISGVAAGSVTLTLMVKDGHPGGTTSQTIQVMVRDANAPPAIVSTVLNADAIGKMSRTGAKRIPSNENTVVMIPMGAFTDANGDALTLTAEVGGTDAAVDDAASALAHKELLAVEIDGGNLVLKPKKGGNNVIIPVVLKAMDRYGASAMTGNDADPNADPITTILVEINTPPMHKTYENVSSTIEDITIPDGASVGDKIMLAHITDKTFSVDLDKEDTAFITLATFFVDPDGEDDITGADHICAFDTSPADQKFATIGLDSMGESIEVLAKMRGKFDLSVTCTDHLGEMVTDMVEVTIIQ